MDKSKLNWSLHSPRKKKKAKFQALYTVKPDYTPHRQKNVNGAIYAQRRLHNICCHLNDNVFNSKQEAEQDL